MKPVFSFVALFPLLLVSLPGRSQVLHHHPDHLHNPIHADIITKHFGDTDVDFEHNVIILTTENFYHLVGAHEILLALFHVSWDPKYLEVVEEFEKAATILQKDHPSICLGRLDVSEHPIIAKKLDLRGEEPQFMFFYKNRAYNFEHSFKAEALVKELVKRQEAVWYPPQSDPDQLIELPKNDFPKALAKHEFAVVLMYSPTRLSGVRLMMEMENAAATMNHSSTFYKLNVADSKDLRNQYGIPPVVRMFRKGKEYDYKGPKVAKGIVNYLRGQMQPPYVRIYSSSELDNFLKKHQDKPTVVGYFENDKLPQFKTFEEAANLRRGDLHFVVVRGFIPQDTVTDEKEKDKWQIGVMLPKHDSDPELVAKDKVKSKENLRTLEELLAFIQYKSTPVVGYRTKKNKDTFYAHRPLFVGYMKIDWSSSGEKETRFVRHRIAQVAIEIPVSKMVFTISNLKDFKDEGERFGFTDLTGEKEELQCGIIGVHGEYYPLRSDEPVTSVQINDFVKKYFAGELKPFYRSEKELPDSENTDPVKIVVGSTFKKIVLEAENEALLSFCHPLCRVCKTVEESMLKIAKLKEYNDVQFLAMDTSLNDPPETYPVKSYPTIYFVPKSNRTDPIKYLSKQYTTAELYGFLDKYASTPRVRVKTEL